MNRYEIYCTMEQTAKAIELGAPIDKCFYSHQVEDDAIKLPNRELFFATIPTASQMIGWLEEQGLHFDAEWSCASRITMDVWNAEHKHVYTNSDSRKEATLAAIDGALDYLIENKK